MTSKIINIPSIGWLCFHSLPPNYRWSGSLLSSIATGIGSSLAPKPETKLNPLNVIQNTSGFNWNFRSVFIHFRPKRASPICHHTRKRTCFFLYELKVVKKLFKKNCIDRLFFLEEIRTALHQYNYPKNISTELLNWPLTLTFQA